MPNTKKPSLNVVIPVYNEEAELADSVGTLASFLESHATDVSWKITIADNASTDKTWGIAKGLERAHPQVVVVHLIKKGRGRAVKQVWMQGDSDVVAYMDVDLSSDLKHFMPMVHAVLRGYDVAIGSRNMKDSRVYGRHIVRSITSKGYIALIKLLFFVHFSDAQCGFKAINKKAAAKLLPLVLDNEWFFDTELLILAEKMGYRIYEEPVTWVDNPGSTVRVWKTAQKDLIGLWRMFTTRPWKGRGTK
jgi:glycosyltransferase involved in cell wall biosynthesis